MSDEATILFIDDEEYVLRVIERQFAKQPYKLLTSVSGHTALEILEHVPVNVVVSDFRMPGMNGGELLAVVADRWPQTVRLVLSGYADIASLITSINSGQIYKFITKPWEQDELLLAVEGAVRKQKHQTKMAALAEEALAQAERMIGRQLSGLPRSVGGYPGWSAQNDDSDVFRVAFMEMAIPAALVSDATPIEFNHAARSLFGCADGIPVADAHLYPALADLSTILLRDYAGPGESAPVQTLHVANHGTFRVLTTQLSNPAVQGYSVVLLTPTPGDSQ